MSESVPHKELMPESLVRSDSPLWVLNKHFYYEISNISRILSETWVVHVRVPVSDHLKSYFSVGRLKRQLSAHQSVKDNPC
jgi:hypothetical protein